MTIAVCYISVLHRGYLDFLRLHPLDELLLLSPEVIPPQIEYLRKDLRAVSPQEMQKALTALAVAPQVEVATVERLLELNTGTDLLLLPDEDISQAVVDQYLSQAEKDGRISLAPVFLRWDKKTATEEKMPSTEHEIPADALLEKWFGMAYREAGKSSDWWRHVGAVIVRDGAPLVTGFNQHEPSEQEPYLDGDARALFHAGEQLDLTTAIHAEASVIGHAARAGIPLAGAQMYVTTFPCPTCAKLIVASGISSLFFSEGYAVFDGERILQSAGVTVVKVLVSAQMKKTGDARSTVIEYPR